jgi:hypothetical protein
VKKPKPRTRFASEADEYNHVLDCMCWLFSEDMSLELDMPHEDCADLYKRLLLEGRLIIDFDQKGDRVRLMPAPSLATN